MSSAKQQAKQQEDLSASLPTLPPTRTPVQTTSTRSLDKDSSEPVQNPLPKSKPVPLPKSHEGRPSPAKENTSTGKIKPGTSSRSHKQTISPRPTPARSANQTEIRDANAIPVPDEDSTPRLEIYFEELREPEAPADAGQSHISFLPSNSVKNEEHQESLSSRSVARNRIRILKLISLLYYIISVAGLLIAVGCFLRSIHAALTMIPSKERGEIILSYLSYFFIGGIVALTLFTLGQLVQLVLGIDENTRRQKLPSDRLPSS